MIPDTELVSSRNGLILTHKNDNEISRRLKNNLVWNASVLNIIDSVFDSQSISERQNSAMIDCGANIGTISVYMAKKCRTVYAFEPSYKNFLHLCANVWINKTFNVISVNKVLSDKSGETMRFQDLTYDHPMNNGDIRFHENKGENEVSSCAIDDCGIKERVSFIKVDCQGMDLIVLKGAKRTIEKDQSVVVFEYEDRYSKEKLDKYEEFFKDLNYSFDYIGDRDFLCKPK